MKRVNGFLNLNDYFELKNNNRERLKQLFDNGFIEKSRYRSGHYWLIINGKKYYYKPLKGKLYKDFLYKELIASRIAKHLGIEAVEYDLAIFRNSIGVISNDYHKPNCKYITGYRLLENYYNENKDIVEKMNLDDETDTKKYHASELNNLEIIWQALESRYKNNPHANISELMYKIVLQYIFCVLIIQEDKGPQNWEIEEGRDKIDLVPLFDNELSFGTQIPYVELSTSIEKYFISMYDSIRHFLTISSKEYQELFVEKFDLLTEEKLLEIIKEIELTIEAEIPFDIKERIFENFRIHRLQIESVLEDFNLNRTGGARSG